MSGNVPVDIDEEEYVKGLQEHCHNLIGRLILSKGYRPLTTSALKFGVFGENRCKLNPPGRSFYNVHPMSPEDKGTAVAEGALFLKSGVFRIS